MNVTTSHNCERDSRTAERLPLGLVCAKLRMAAKTVKEKDAPAVAPVVFGVGTTVRFKSGLSAVIKFIEDMPSDQSDSSSSDSDLSDDGGSSGGKESKVKEQKKVYILEQQNGPVAGAYQIQEWRPADLHRFASAAARFQVDKVEIDEQVLPSDGSVRQRRCSQSAAARFQVEERYQLPEGVDHRVEDDEQVLSSDGSVRQRRCSPQAYEGVLRAPHN